MFSQDDKTIGNIQSCLQDMSVLEPDLILQPIMERSTSALQGFEETECTIACIKALESVISSLVLSSLDSSKEEYLVKILYLLLPGIDIVSLSNGI